MSRNYYGISFNLIAFSLFMVLSSALHAQKKLPKNISRATSVEYAPSISADGKTMIFQTDLYQLGARYNLYATFKNPSGYWDNPKELRTINTYGTKDDLIGGPSVSYDGNTLFFFANFPGGKGGEDIYYSKRTGDEFGKPINIGSAINTSGYEGFPSISPDGSTLYFTRAAEEQTVEGVFCYSIWASERGEDGEWKEPYKLPAPINMGCERNPRIMTDNEMLVFASIREGSLGTNKFDLFYSNKDENGKWGPVNPLSNVNTFDDEIFAAISACGDEMYIIARTPDPNREFVNLDIYEATLADNEKPRAVSLVQGRILDEQSGRPLSGEIVIVKNGNTESPGIIYNNKNGAFTTILTRGNNYSVTYKVPGHEPKEVLYDMTAPGGCQTIKADVKMEKWRSPYTLTVLNSRTGEIVDAQATIREPKEKGGPSFRESQPWCVYTRLKTNQSYTVSVTDSLLSDTTFTFRPVVKGLENKEFSDTVRLNPGPPKMIVRVINKETGAPVPNAVLLVMNAQKRETMFRGLMKEDQVAFDVNYTNTFVAFGVAPNHFSSRQVLDMTKKTEEGVIEVNLELVELKPGAKLVVNNITFATNSAELTKSSFTEIDQVINVLKQNSHIKIEIAAHTDDIGTDENNMVLSNARAKSVLDYMTSKGIAANRLISKGYGESDPAVPNNSAANRALNRRVEFRVPKN